MIQAEALSHPHHSAPPPALTPRRRNLQFVELVGRAVDRDRPSVPPRLSQRPLDVGSVPFGTLDCSLAYGSVGALDDEAAESSCAFRWVSHSQLLRRAR